MLLRQIALLLITSCGYSYAQDRILVHTPPKPNLKRLALVIGNDTYERAPLTNAVNDAQAMAAALEEVGFDVSLALNVDRKKMAREVDAFVERLPPGGTALFFFAGHGAQVDGENYLVPVGFNGVDQTDLKYDSVPAGQVLEKLERSAASVRIIILDACRDNPFTGRRSGGGGLAAMNAAAGTYIAFSTAPGRTADDNPRGHNGLFTGELVGVLREPNLTLDQVFNQVREYVTSKSGGSQVPWSVSSLVGEFVFRSDAGEIEDPAAMLSKYKFSAFATANAGQCCAAWSPDGKAVAYIGSTADKPRLYLRYLDRGRDIRLPEIPHLEPGGIINWSSDSREIFAATSEGKEIKLWSIPIPVGKPEQIEIPKLGEALALAPDGKTGATFMRRAAREAITLWSFSLPGHELRPYMPDPFATRALREAPTLAFSPDGHKLLLMFAGDGKRQSWMIPWPSGSGEPKLILPDLDRIAEYHVPFAWMPDNRHIVISPITAASWGHLYIADTESGRISQFTMGLGSEYRPSISPDGQKLIFEARESDLNITSVALADGKVSNLIATEASESMPSWSSRTNRLVYVSDRNGEPEIWVRDADGSDLVLIGAREMPPGCISPMNPTLSPNGSRIVYICVTRNEGAHLWIASLEGDAPARLTNSTLAKEMGGSWSPDGKWFAYIESSAGRPHLMKVGTTGQSAPVAIQEAGSYVPDWSHTGNWISYWHDGWNLTSPDGKMTRKLGDFHSEHITFSVDGKRIWFVCDEPKKVRLISFDLEGNKENIVADLGLANRPASDMDEGIRFSISPDGKSLVYATRNDRRTLRMLEGFPKRPFGGIFH